MEYCQIVLAGVLFTGIAYTFALWRVYYLAFTQCAFWVGIVPFFYEHALQVAGRLGGLESLVSLGALGRAQLA